MKKTPYIITSVVAFLLAFCFAHVIAEPLSNWLVPDGTTITSFYIIDYMRVSLFFAAALAVMLAFLPISVLILQSKGDLTVVVAASVLVGVVSAFAVRMRIYSHVDLASQFVAVDTYKIHQGEIPLELVPIASLFAAVLTTIVLKLRKKAMENLRLERDA